MPGFDDLAVEAMERALDLAPDEAAIHYHAGSSDGARKMADANLDAFNLDDRVSASEAPAENECAHDDYTGLNAQPGVDYNFLRIIEDEQTQRRIDTQLFNGYAEWVGSLYPDEPTTLTRTVR